MGEEFDPLSFEKRLTLLKDTQESIQSMSNWCLKQRQHHKKIVSSWLNVLKRVKVEQRLVLFYLANDVIQYSKRKNYDFVESWGLNLQKATPLVRDEKVRPKILRIFKIWEQRGVYDEEFLSDLTGLLSAGAVRKASDDDATDFQPQQLVNKIKQCAVLEGDTDKRLQQIHESKLSLTDADVTCAILKERRNACDVESIEKELADGIERVERYTAAMQREIVAREALLALLASALEYYGRQRKEVKVVAYAYKNFGARVRCLKRKLDERAETLPSRASRTPSPPLPHEHVPSPAPDDDLALPGCEDTTNSYNVDKTFSTSISDGNMYSGGFSSFLGNGNMFDIFSDNNASDTGSKIEVINSAPAPVEKSDFSISDFLKNLTSEPPPVTTGVLSSQSNVTLPGLDLATQDATLAPPQINLYGSLDTNSRGASPALQTSQLVPPPDFNMERPLINLYGSLDNEFREEPEPYVLDPQWNNTPASWGATVSAASPMARLTTPPLVSYAETPESPVRYPQESSMHDIDHRGMLPPPPPPPPILPTMPIIDAEDVDHRQMPVLPPAPLNPPRLPQISHKDVDHRNLIPLTSHPPQQNARPIQGIDQDYRVPPPVPPPDIVETVDMELSDDEHTPSTDSYQNDRLRYQPNFTDRHKNNKVLVGGDNGTRPRSPKPPRSAHPNPEERDFDQPAPIKPMVNPFDSKEFDFPGFEHDDPMEEAMDLIHGEADFNDFEHRNPSPPRQEWRGEDRFQQRFARPWGQQQQRPFFRPFGAPRQFRPPMNRPWYPRQPKGGYW